MQKLNVLVVGSGGREHRICKNLGMSPQLGRLVCTPGNPGIAEIALCADISWAETPNSFDRFASTFDLVVIGPERPLVAGLADRLRARGTPVFGPGKDGALLEGSKVYAKNFMTTYGIPTAACLFFRDRAKLAEYLRTIELPKVLKADGLMEGKGAVVIRTKADIDAAIAKTFVEGKQCIVENFMSGEEISVTYILDGKKAFLLPCSRDHKRALDGDKGSNTGGMGAHSPSYWSTHMRKAMLKRIEETILAPTGKGLRAEGIDFRGVLYINIMLTSEGPKVIDYNVRFGDPECQVLLMRMYSDLLPLLYDCAIGNAAGHTPEIDLDPAICVVMSSKGYPDATDPCGEIRNLSAVARMPGVEVLHAGTKMQNGVLVPNGGRVLNICATGETFKIAKQRAYEAIRMVDWQEGEFRTDIGHRFE